MWRARFPWRESLGMPQGPGQVRGFKGDQAMGLMYSMPDDVVCHMTHVI